VYEPSQAEIVLDASLMDAVGNDDKHNHHGGEQPGPLALFLVREQGNGDEQANAYQRVHGAAFSATARVNAAAACRA
jgi:hypothetical protein